MEIKKILVISEQKFQELQKEFKVFFQGLRGRISQRSSNQGRNKRQILRPQQASVVFEPRIGYYRDYEPTNAIYCNNSKWRRWKRVKEWFSQYAQGTEEQILQKGILIQ